MSVALGPVRRVGDVAVAALCRTAISKTAMGRAGIFACDKRPVAILCLQDGAIRAMRPDGSALSEAEVEALCPGVLATFAGTSDAAG